MRYISRDRSDMRFPGSLALRDHALDLREGEKYIANSPVRLSPGRQTTSRACINSASQIFLFDLFRLSLRGAASRRTRRLSRNRESWRPLSRSVGRHFVFLQLQIQLNCEL